MEAVGSFWSGYSVKIVAALFETGFEEEIILHRDGSIETRRPAIEELYTVDTTEQLDEDEQMARGENLDDNNTTDSETTSFVLSRNMVEDGTHAAQDENTMELEQGQQNRNQAPYTIISEVQQHISERIYTTTPMVIGHPSLSDQALARSHQRRQQLLRRLQPSWRELRLKTGPLEERIYISIPLVLIAHSAHYESSFNNETKIENQDSPAFQSDISMDNQNDMLEKNVNIKRLQDIILRNLLPPFSNKTISKAQANKTISKQ